MTVKEDLQIILITYNREHELSKTLNKLFESESPVKDCSILVIDNSSTDNTESLCAEFQNKYENFHYQKNKCNIGISGNIIKAMESAEKKYVWFLCDNDIIDWTYFNEVQDVFEKDYDAIVVERNLAKEDLTKAKLANELSFLPAAIYKTENITSEVISNAYVNAYTLFPHMALVCDLLNRDKNIYILDHTIIQQTWVAPKTGEEYTRTSDSNIHFRQKNFNLFVGFINSFQMIKDETLRHEACEHLYLGESFETSINLIYQSGGFKNCYNYSDFYNGISKKQKRLLNKMFFKIKYLGINKEWDRIVIRFFGIKITFKTKH